MTRLLSYTRLPIDNVIYDPRLAFSMHLALEINGEFTALNHNSGVLFALGTENEDGSVNPMSLKSPYIYDKGNGEYGVAAVRILGDGDADESSKGCILSFSTSDFISYKEEGLIKLSEEHIDRVACRCENGKPVYAWTDINGCHGTDGILAEIPSKTPQIQGIIPQNIIDIPDELAQYIFRKLMTPENTEVIVPDTVSVGRADPAGWGKPANSVEPAGDIPEAVKEKLEAVTARAIYSDGSAAFKKIDWDYSSLPADYSVGGSYKICGRIRKEHFEFPVAFNRADPCVAKWNGKYYFIATNDADGNHSLYIRESETLTGLVDAQEHLILDSSTYEGIGGLLWAPEFHVVNGKMYIFHACTPGEFFFEESHIMALREGGDPTKKEDWSRPRRIVRKDGTDLCEAGKEITLDMTCFEWENDYYVVWSQRQFLPKDLGAWLYIAKLNPEAPHMLASDPVVLSKPLYGWANNHTFVDEGPFALLRGETLYLTFSSAAVDTSYVVGLFTIHKGMDLLEASNWKKTNYPILTSRSVEGEFGTGHNAYVTDDDGNVWNTYHARPGVDGVRSSGIRRVHFDFEGEPRLDVTEEIDVREEFMNVSTTLNIIAQ